MENNKIILQRIPIGKIFGSYFIDALLLFVLGVFSVGLGVVTCRLYRNLLSDVGWIMLWNILGPVTTLIYYALTEGKRGCSFGKRMFRLQTVTAQTHTTASCGRIVTAYAIDIILLAFFAFPMYFGISLVFVLLTEKLGAMMTLLNSIGGGYLLCEIPLLILHFTVWEHFCGFSAGKGICGLRVYQEK